MLPRRTMAVAAALAAVAGGSAVAIGATVSDEAKQAEAEVLGDAAKQLGVEPSALEKALRAALDAQLDEAVKAGRLTQQQADEIKKRRAESGTVLGPALRRGPHGHHRGMHGDRGGRRATMAAAAKALGLTEAELHEQLRDGRTIAALAKARSRDLAAVKAAMRKAVVDRLEADVKAGRLTDARRDEIVSRLDARIDDKVNGRRGPGPRGVRRFRGGPPPGAHGFPGGPPPGGPRP